MRTCASDVVGETVFGGGILPVERGSVIAPTRETTGNIAAMALYAGQSVANIHSVMSVADVMRELVGAAAEHSRG